MARILAIDYGRKRVGVAVTDPMQIIATALDTIHSKDIFEFLGSYMAKESVERIIVGYPVQMNNTPSEAVKFIDPFLNRLRKLYPEMPVELVDERFTSKMAFQTMIDGGLGKEKRKDKALVDRIAATIILQSYIDNKK